MDPELIAMSILNDSVIHIHEFWHRKPRILRKTIDLKTTAQALHYQIILHRFDELLGLATFLQHTDKLWWRTVGEMLFMNNLEYMRQNMILDENRIFFDILIRCLSHIPQTPNGYYWEYRCFWM